MRLRYTGYDRNGVARVWGEHENADVAETVCRQEAHDYVRGRPDTGPLYRWSFTHDEKRK